MQVDTNPFKPWRRIMEKSTEKKSTAKNVFGIFGAIVFFLSYVPYIFVISAGITGVQRGLIGGPYIYGFDAMFNNLTWFCIIPIIPICAIYQLVFGFLYIRKRKILTVATLLLVAGIIIAFISVGLSFENKKNSIIRADAASIKTNLALKYGDEMAGNIGIQLMDYDDHSYYVITDVLPQGDRFTIYPEQDYRDDLITEFELYNDSFHDDLTNYVNRQNNLPDNMSFSIVTESINFGDYKDGDDYSVLFEKTKYRLTGITVDTAVLNDDTVLEIISDVWNDHAGKFENEDYYNLYIKQNGKNAFIVTVYYSPDKKEGTADISTYSDYQGDTRLNGAVIALER